MAKIKAYLCGVTFQHEIGHTQVTLYGSEESLKRAEDCWRQCGIVEIEFEPKLIRWIETQDFSRKIEADPVETPAPPVRKTRGKAARKSDATNRRSAKKRKRPYKR